MKKRAELGDAMAIYSLGSFYSNGDFGLPRDMDKALELWHRAAELDYTKAYYNIALCYAHGRSVERDEKKATHYYELAAMGVSVNARYNLGCGDANAGNMDRALKHFMIAVGSGERDSLKAIQLMYKDRYATKDDYMKALQAYQAYLGEIKSVDREKAAEYDELYKYYEC